MIGMLIGCINFMLEGFALIVHARLKCIRACHPCALALKLLMTLLIKIGHACSVLMYVFFQFMAHMNTRRQAPYFEQYNSSAHCLV